MATTAANSTRSISVEHVTIGSNKPFEDVRAKLETLVPRIDDGIFTLLRYGESERARRELEACPRLSIFGQRNHGALLSIADFSAALCSTTSAIRSPRPR